MSRKSCLIFASLSVSGRKTLGRTTRNLRIMDFAFEHLSVICDGPCLTFFQQHVSDRIDWCANVVNAENIEHIRLVCPAVFACVFLCSRSTQRLRRTNLSVMGSVRPENVNEKITAWHSSILAFKCHTFSLFSSPCKSAVLWLCRQLSSARKHC